VSEKNTLHRITLYSKEGCHLCENAKEALFELEDDFEIELKEVDITTRSELFEKYKYTIPVMVVDDAIVLESRIDARKIYRALAEGYGPKLKD
jgi:glutaredoxin